MERVEGFALGFEGPTAGPGKGSSEGDSDCRAVIRVLTTQIGLVISTVALPAMAPAIMDSIVVSFLEAREERIAARSKKARVHSYPVRTRSAIGLDWAGEQGKNEQRV